MKRPNLRTWWASPSSAQQCPATPSNAQPAQVPKLRLVCNLGDLGDDPFSLKEASLHPDLPFGRTSAQSFCNCLPEFSSQHTDDLCQLLISVCGWLPWAIINFGACGISRSFDSENKELRNALDLCETDFVSFPWHIWKWLKRVAFLECSQTVGPDAWPGSFHSFSRLQSAPDLCNRPCI